MRFFWIFSVIFSVACSQRNSFETVQWKNGDDIRELHFLNEIQSSLPSTVHVLDENIEYSQQTFAGIEIADTFVKRINNQSGALQAVTAVYKKKTVGYEKLPLHHFKVTSELKNKIRSLYPHIALKEINSLEPVIIAPQQLVWRLTHFSKNGIPHILKLDEELKLISDDTVGISWFDQRVLVYPQGPKFSELKEITFHDISFSPALSNSNYEITSTIQAPFFQNPAPLKFASSDPRLDQLQVYYYVEQALLWIKTELGIYAPLKLDVQLHVGHPEKTNAAFYYNGNIRLGEGDGITYAKIPQDPTIVSHEVFHALIDLLAHLPTEGEGGSLNEAFADYFTSQILGKPQLGDTAYLQGPFKRSLDIEKKWTEKKGGLYGDSLIISSLLWHLSAVLPATKIHKVALRTLAHLTPASDFKHFNSEIRAALKELLNAEEFTRAQEIMRTRDFPI